jgi:hypothetical protein
MAEQNGHRPWARVFRFGMAWVYEQAFDFEGARAVCEQEFKRQDSQLGQGLGLIVLGAAHLGLGEFDRALDLSSEINRQLDGRSILMDWILQMPFQLGWSECRLARGEIDLARREAERLCELAARPPERTYLALGHHLLAEIALAEGSLDRAEGELSTAFVALAGEDAPLAEWRVHVTAATLHGRRKHKAQAKRHLSQSAETLLRLKDSLLGWPELQRSLISHAGVQAVLAE